MGIGRAPEPQHLEVDGEYNLHWADLSDGLEQLGRMDRRRNGQGKTRFFTQIREPLGIPLTEGEPQVL